MTKYKDYTIEIFWDEECQSWFYDIHRPSPGVKLLDYMGSDSEAETLQAAKNRIDEEIERLKTTQVFKTDK